MSDWKGFAMWLLGVAIYWRFRSLLDEIVSRLTKLESDLPLIDRAEVLRLYEVERRYKALLGGGHAAWLEACSVRFASPNIPDLVEDSPQPPLE